MYRLDHDFEVSIPSEREATENVLDTQLIVQHLCIRGLKPTVWTGQDSAADRPVGDLARLLFWVLSARHLLGDILDKEAVVAKYQL